MNKPVPWIKGSAIAVWFSGATLALDQGSWIGTWATSPVGLPTVAKIGSHPVPPPTRIKGTIRYRLRVSLGGNQIRLKFSNEYNNTPLTLAVATVGLAGDGLDALPGSLKRATFKGKQAITIPAGAIALTDPIDISVKSLGDLVVSVYIPDGITQSVWTSPTDPIVVEGTDATLRERLSASRSLSVRPVVSEVDMLVGTPRKVVVALGDSITDAFVDPESGERGWAGALARRLQSQDIAVVNAGIGGNRLLQSQPMFGVSALTRLDRDVFSIPGVSHIIVLEGINDIGMSGPGGIFGDTPLVSAKDLIGAYSQIITRAHERGIKVFGATVIPFEGADYYSADKEKVRQTINEWIRTSNMFDGIVDFDAAVRDAADPRKLKADYDSGDHLHPNAAGERHMGEIIDLHLFH